MMKTIFVLLLFTSTISGEKLTKEENRILQEHCGKPVPVRRSMHTKQVARSEAPWVARIEYLMNQWFPGISLEMRNLYGEAPGGSAACSGTLISPRHVLTAAHCIGEFRAFVAPSYTGSKCKNYLPGGDAAVFELAEDVPYSDQLYPACLNENPLKISDELVLYGYGVNGTDETNRALRKSETKVVDCSKIRDKPVEDSICDADMLRRNCHGDSGGGKMVFDRRGTAIVAAIVSGGYGSCEVDLVMQSRFPFEEVTFNTRVDKQLHWICAATGICANEEISKTVEDYEKRGLTKNWYHIILPLSGFDLYI